MSEGTKQVTIRIPPSLHEALKRLAHKRETTLSALITTALEKELQEHAAKPHHARSA